MGQYVQAVVYSVRQSSNAQGALFLKQNGAAGSFRISNKGNALEYKWRSVTASITRDGSMGHLARKSSFMTVAPQSHAYAAAFLARKIRWMAQVL